MKTVQWKHCNRNRLKHEGCVKRTARQTHAEYRTVQGKSHLSCTVGFDRPLLTYISQLRTELFYCPHKLPRNRQTLFVLLNNKRSFKIGSVFNLFQHAFFFHRKYCISFIPSTTGYQLCPAVSLVVYPTVGLLTVG